MIWNNKEKGAIYARRVIENMSRSAVICARSIKNAFHVHVRENDPLIEALDLLIMRLRPPCMHDHEAWLLAIQTVLLIVDVCQQLKDNLIDEANYNSLGPWELKIGSST